MIIGKTEIERREFINALIRDINFECFRFPPNMKSFNEYCDFIKQKKLYKPWYKAKSYNINQVLDFHWDWISENNPLIIMEEFGQMEERWQIELLRIYLNKVENRKKGEKKVHLIISQESENGLIEKLAKVISKRENERRTEKQIVEQNLEVIDIAE
ncbi:MAG: hypothetical protein AAF740_02510 [Bacteroidota bacterium]